MNFSVTIQLKATLGAVLPCGYKGGYVHNLVNLTSRGGGRVPYESDGDARRLAQGCKLQILVSLRVFRKGSQYFYPFRYRLGCA